MVAVLYLNSEYVSSKEIGALIDISIAQAMFIGMIVGNIIYLIFFWDRTGFSLKNIFTFLFTP